MHYGHVALLVPILATVLFAEVAVRIALKYLFKYDSSLMFDPVVGWRLRPNLAGARKWTSEFSYTVHTDARGFRVSAGAQVPPDAPADIMILGDSFAFGEGVEAEQSIAGLLARDFPSLRIVNTAVPNYSADQELLTLQNTANLLAPNALVILLTYINDFDEILRKSAAGIPKPWCELGNSDLVVHEPSSLLDHIRGKSILVRLGARLLLALGIAAPVEHVFDAEAARLYRAVMLAMGTTVREAGARLFVAYTSGKERQPSSRLTWADFVCRCAREAGAEFVNLDESPLATSPGAFFEKDIHWTAAGTEVNYRYVFARLFGPSAKRREPERPSDRQMAS